MDKINFQDLPNTTTPVRASNLNQLQTNVENVFNGTVPMGNIIVDSIETSNKLNIYDFISDTAIANVTNNQVILTSAAAFGTAYVEIKGLKPNTQYTISLTYEQQGTSTTIRLSPRYLESPNDEVNPINATAISGVINTTITTSISGNLRIYFYSNFANTTINTQLKLTNVQIKEGSTVQTYSQYQKLDNIGYVLYNNTTGSNSTITLNDIVTNYKFIEIFYIAEESYSSTKVFLPNTQTISLSDVLVYNGYSYVKNSRWHFNGNQVVLDANDNYNVHDNLISNQNNQAHIKIVAVIGYK